MKRELLYGFFAILSTFVFSFILFSVLSSAGAVVPYLALSLNLLLIITFTHFYFSKTPNAIRFTGVMVGATILLYAAVVGVVAGKGIVFIYSAPFWATLLEALAVPFLYAKLKAR